MEASQSDLYRPPEVALTCKGLMKLNNKYIYQHRSLWKALESTNHNQKHN